MVQFNFSERTIKAKVVYYGPPQSGKTTNLEQIHRLTDPEGTNRLISLNTAQDRTLFFDLLPFSLGTVSGYDFKIQLYTVPGQVQYNATRRVVLAGADAVVFVADSQKAVARDNLTAFENMKVNLLANRLVPEKVPLVLQYNKQDLQPVVSRAELDRALNFWGRQAFPAVATRGEGVIETFVAIVQDMLAAIAVKYNLKEKGLDPEAVPEIVAQAFTELLQRKGARPPLPVGRPAAARVVVAAPETTNAAYPGQPPGSSALSEELLHRSIRSNVELAEVFSRLVSDMTKGLGRIRAKADALDAGSEPAVLAASAIRAEADRLRQRLQELGIRAPAAAPPPASTPAVPIPAATLDGLLAEVAGGLQPALAQRPVSLENRLARATPLPRCPPARLRRSLSAVLQGLATAVRPASTIAVRAERKPVLLRGRDGSEVKRDFLMLAFAHTNGLAEDRQQQVLRGAEPGPLGDGQRGVREMGGFVRFAPLPGGGLETRLFLPL